LYLDANANDPRAIAIEFSDNSNGVWQYSLNNGNSWLELGTISETKVLRLAADRSQTRLRVVPKAGFSGTVAIRFRGWDQTDGLANGILAEIGAKDKGGQGSMSIDVETATIFVSQEVG